MIQGGENRGGYKHLRRGVASVVAVMFFLAVGKLCVATYIYLSADGEARVDEVGAFGVAGNSLERAFPLCRKLVSFLLLACLTINKKADGK